MIEIKDIEKSFDGTKVLKGINLHVNKGRIYGLIGKNGAGKTTLMNIISGLSGADKGECYLAGEKQSKGKILKAHISYLPDIPGFFDYLTTAQYLDFLLKDLNGTERTAKRNELLWLVQIDKDRKIKNMSRGMKQRMGIAAALANDPEIMLLDEPTSALDPAGRHDLMAFLKVLKEQGRTIILSTHILEDMEKTCDEVGFLNGGVISRHIEMSDLRTQSEGYRFSFATPVDISDFNAQLVKITREGELDYLIEPLVKDLDTQKYILGILEQTGSLITSVRPEAVTLDDLFQEELQI